MTVRHSAPERGPHVWCVDLKSLYLRRRLKAALPEQKRMLEKPGIAQGLEPVGFYQVIKLSRMLRFSRLEEGFEAPVQRPGLGARSASALVCCSLTPKFHDSKIPPIVIVAIA
jgi:hypothetical protein